MKAATRRAAILVQQIVSQNMRWPVWKSKFYGAFVLNHRVVLHAIDAAPARWRGDAGSSPLDRARKPDALVDFHTGGGVRHAEQVLPGEHAEARRARAPRLEAQSQPRGVHGH